MDEFSLPSEVKNDVAWDACFVNLSDVSCKSLTNAGILRRVLLSELEVTSCLSFKDEVSP